MLTAAGGSVVDSALRRAGQGWGLREAPTCRTRQPPAAWGGLDAVGAG